MSQPLESALRVMLVDDDLSRVCRIENELTRLGLVVCARVSDPMKVLKEISLHQPDVILIDMASPGRDVLESLSVVAAHQPTPVVMFSSEQDPDYIHKAVEAGVSTYLVGSIEPEKVRPIIDVALAQFQSFQHLKRALDESRSELSERRVIERAKLCLIQTYHLQEAQAYEQLQRQAMNSGLRLVEVAQRVLERFEAAPEEQHD